MLPFISTLISILIFTTTDHLQSSSGSNMNINNKTLYFAYGSNLLEERLHVSIPTATRISIAKLENYRLDFGYWSDRWKGCVATVVPDDSKHVWGAVWSIYNDTVSELDKQEGVHDNIYIPIEVLAQNPEGEYLICRSYQLVKLPSKLQEGELPSNEQRPSQVYLQVIKTGAIESGLPESYIEYIKKIPHNGYNGPVDVKINIPSSQ